MRTSNLQWSDLKKKFLMKMTKQKRMTPKTGVSCVYFPLSKSEGVKFYRTKKTRDRTYLLQQRAAKFGLAPKVGQRFYIDCFSIEPGSFGGVDSRRVYGFLTERAQVRRGYFNEYHLEEQLKNIGIIHHDLHYENVGRLNGRLVCIDFDSCSCKTRKKNGRFRTRHR